MSGRARHSFGRALGVLIAVGFVVGGCGWTRTVTRQLADGIEIRTAGGESLWQPFDRAVWAEGDGGTCDVVLTKESAGEPGELGRVVQSLWIRRQWRHVPGRSAMDVSSTNCIVRYRIATGGGWREYRGAGAVRISERLGDRRKCDLRHATLRSVAAGGDLHDLYGPATMHGRTTAVHDEAAVAAQIASFIGIPAVP